MLETMSTPRKLGFYGRLFIIRTKRHLLSEQAFAVLGLGLIAVAMAMVMAMAAGCDPALKSAIPDQLRRAACVDRNIAAGVTVLEDARADARTQAEKVRDAVPILPQDIDGTTALVNVASKIRACREAQ